MMDSTCIVKCFIFYYCIIHSIMLLLIQKCYIYAFGMLHIYLIVYHFVHNIILIIMAHFYIFRLFFFQITENYLLICFISAIYMFKITIVDLFLANIHFEFYFQCYYG